MKKMWLGLTTILAGIVLAGTAQAETSLSFTDLNKALSGNTLKVGGSTSDLVVSGVATNNNYIYSVTYTNDFDGDAVNDTLTFEVLVEAWGGGAVALDGTSPLNAVTDIGIATIGTNDLQVSLGAEGWGVDNGKMNFNQTLEYTLQNFSVSNSLGGTYSAALNNFTGMFLDEAGRGYGHRSVFGEGTELDAVIWNGNTLNLANKINEWNPFYVSQAVLSGASASNPQNWQIQDVDFNILVWDSAINQVPETAPQSVSTTPETPVVISLVARDLDGGSLTYAVVDVPTNGMVTGSGPDMTYTPTNGFQGADSFTFTVSDGEDTSAASTVSITVTNMVPVADDQSVQTVPDTAVDITLTGTDTDGPSNLTYTVTSLPTSGSLTGDVPNVTYIPTNGFIGADSFTFTVFDGWDHSATATVSIAVENQVPVADDQSVDVYRYGSVGITLTGTDPDNAPSNLTYTVLSDPTNGMPTGTAPALTYTVTNDLAETDSFTFKVNDGLDDSDPATVTINVLNNPPVADSKLTLTQPDTAVAILLSGSDLEGSNLTFAVASDPANGFLSGTEPNLTYTPTNGFTGTDSFTYTANDGEGDSAAATVTIQVSADGSIDLSCINFNTSLSGNGLTIGGIPAQVAGVYTNNNYLYSVVFTDADFDGDTVNDTLSFEVLVEAWAGGSAATGIEGNDAFSTTNIATATIGTNDVQVTLGGSGFAVNGNNIAAGQSLEFTVQNLSVAASSSSASAAATGFVGVRLAEYNGGYGHQTVVGSGTGLLGVRWNNPNNLTGFNTGNEALLLTAGVNQGAGSAQDRWQATNLKFNINIKPGGVPDVSIGVSGGNLVFSWEGSATYDVLTNANLAIPNWGVAIPAASSPVTNAVGSEPQLFYKLSE